ncbi:PspC domain-containing protein [Metabacillus sp. RGM 3146]|uniref:PspC domain-containing protein n=1 Tax=Metabacillus sp. RGM 3146 TaxID=3401092 RepID=UPI003B9A0365
MKRLYRSRKDRKLGGVLGGLSDLISIDATILRILFIILFVFTGFFPLGLIYIIWLFVVPNEEDLRRG